MSLILTVCYLGVAGALLWQSANSPDRDMWRRARLYTLGFACMTFGAAQFMALLGEDATEWRWMVGLGHGSLLAFSTMWIAREVGWLAQFKADAGTKV